MSFLAKLFGKNPAVKASALPGEVVGLGDRAADVTGGAADGEFNPTLRTTGYLSELFGAHDVASVVHNGWVAPNGELPAIRATWNGREGAGRLDVEVLVREGVLIEECFAGVGESEAGLNDALANFTINSFHVLLAALWGQNDASQVTTEDWRLQGKRYTAYIGNFGTRSSDVTPQVPSGLFAEIEKVIKLEPLTEETHWFRLFFGNVAGQHTFEALRDNETWEVGEDCLKAMPWASSDGCYSVRLFAVLRAT